MKTHKCEFVRTHICEFCELWLEYVCKPKSDGNFAEIVSSSEWKAFTVENEPVANDITMAVFANKKWFD